MSRFIKVKTGLPTEWNPKNEYRFIDLDSIIEVQEHHDDPSICFVTLAGKEWTTTVHMPAEALVLIIQKPHETNT